jgi:predicted TIM-barrel fold metal-dependent hydrolase
LDESAFLAERSKLSVIDNGDGVEALDDFADFYYDTALSGSPAALPRLLAFANPGHVLYGSDWPFAPTVVGDYFNNLLDNNQSLDTETRAGIDRKNAEALFASGLT